jgi:pyruvate dehydrogenase E1 component alpha subunit
MDTAEKKSMLLTMYMIRCFEDAAKQSYQRNLVRGALHLYTGEEAVAVGVCSALRRDDYVGSTHRGHGHCLAKGADVKRMMAELFGRADGYCGGRGGSMHICDLGVGVIGADGIVGGSIPLAVGAGFSVAYQKTDRVVVSFFGDGASNQGSFHESLNLASLWRLPVVFVCENNGYAITTPARESLSVEDVADRAVGYGMEGRIVDGMDVLAVREAAEQAVAKARAGGGPTLLECKTYRFEGHWYGDPVVYRTKEEVAENRSRDPILRLRRMLTDEGCSEAELDAVADEAKQIIDEAVAYAEASAIPEPESVATGVMVPVDE